MKCHPTEHLCDDKWVEGKLEDCPKHGNPGRPRRYVSGANTMSGYHPPKKERRNGTG